MSDMCYSDDDLGGYMYSGCSDHISVLLRMVRVAVAAVILQCMCD